MATYKIDEQDFASISLAPDNSITMNGITISLTQGNISNGNFQFHAAGSFSVAGEEITAITINASMMMFFSGDGWTKDPSTATWSGKSATVSFADAQAMYVSSITVTTETPKYTLTSLSAIPDGDVIFTVGGSEVTEAAADATVTVAGKEVEGYYVTGFTSDDVTITDNTFTMPANAVSVMVNYAQYDERIVVPSTEYPSPYTLETGKTYTCAPTTAEGGAVNVGANGTVTGTNVTFSGNIASDCGGAICNKKGTVMLDGATFSGNRVTKERINGGAIYIYGDSTVTIKGTAFFSKNTSACLAGAIYNYGTISMEGGTFSENIAELNGGAIENAGNMTIDGDVTFTGNIATGKSVGNGMGGAIRNGNGGTLSLASATFSGNTATSNGGAIYNNKGTISFTGSSVSFSGNTAGQSGGAIYNKGGTISFAGLMDLQIATDTWVNTGSYVQKQRKYATVNWDLTGGLDQYGSIKNFQQYSNIETTVGGGSELLVSQTITVSATQAEGNYVIATGDFDMEKLTENKSTNFTVHSEGGVDTNITINGGIQAHGDQNYKLTLKESEVPGMDQLVLTVFTYDDRIVVPSEKYPSSCELQEGKTYTAKLYAGNGGAVEVKSGGTVTGKNVSFVGNTATNPGLGGAIYNYDGTITFAGATFTDNSAFSAGGAIYNTGNAAVLTITDGATFSGNTTNQYGGAIVNGGTLTIHGGATFSNNTATDSPVGVYLGGAIRNGGTLTIHGDAIFADNTAKSAGGAIYNGGSTAVLTITDGATFSNNTSTFGGGAICNSKALTIHGDAIFENNTVTDANGNGGAICNEGGTIHLAGATFSDNTATGANAKGGAIYNHNDDTGATGVITFAQGAIFSGNNATQGGGAIYNGIGGAINFAGAITLKTATDTWVNEGSEPKQLATVNWDLSAASNAVESTACINGYQYYSNANQYVKQTITVTADQAEGEYVLATGDLSDHTNEETIKSGKYTFTVTDGSSSSATLTIGGTVKFGNNAYSLSVSGSNETDAKLVLNVAELLSPVYTIDDSINRTYDGTAATISVNVTDPATATVSYSLDGGKTWETGNSYSLTDVGTQNVTFEIKADQYKTVTENRTITITPRNVMMTSASDAKEYDGTPLTNNTVTVSGDGFASGEGATYDVTGSQTEVGSSLNEFDYVLNEGTRAGNYVIMQEYGTLTVVEKQSVRSDFNCSGKSDIAQLNGGILTVTYDTASSFVKSGALWGVGDWQVVEFEGDYNGDNYADVLMTHYNADNDTTSVAALLNQQGTTISFAHDDIRGFANSDWEYLGAADVNGDGITDVLTIQTAASAGDNDRSINAWLLDSSGQYANDVRVGGVNAEWKVIGDCDVNGNDVDNVVLQHDGGWVSYWATPGSDMTMIKSVQDRTMLGSGDFDGDGKGDILWKYNNDDTLWSWTHVDQGENLTDTRLGQVSELAGSWTFDRIGDYDGDGKDELLWSTTDGKLAYSEANPTDFKNLITIA